MKKLQKKLVIYYSLEGNTRFIAESIAEEIGADILELKPIKDIPSKGFIRYLLGGKQVIFKEKPDLAAWNIDPDKYDIIFIGTPVWAKTYVPAFNTFFSNIELRGKKVALFCCHGGGGRGKTFDRMKNRLKENEIIGELELQDPLKESQDISRKMAKQWAKELIEV